VPWALALLIALLFAATPTCGEAAPALEGVVVRIVDGDTIHVRLADRVEKVRYIGVNTPELHHPTRGEEPGGREARDVNRGLVEGRRVRLEVDVQARDRHGRLLAYVWVGDVMVNAELVRLGFAQVMTVPPNVRHQALFVKLQRDARAARRGLWAQPTAGVLEQFAGDQAMTSRSSMSRIWSMRRLIPAASQRLISRRTSSIRP
jgi:micrococcal nuclease